MSDYDIKHPFAGPPSSQGKPFFTTEELLEYCHGSNSAARCADYCANKVAPLLERLRSADEAYSKLGAKLCFYAADLETYSKQIEKLKEENERLRFSLQQEIAGLEASQNDVASQEKHITELRALLVRALPLIAVVERQDTGDAGLGRYGLEARFIRLEIEKMK